MKQDKIQKHLLERVHIDSKDFKQQLEAAANAFIDEESYPDWYECDLDLYDDYSNSELLELVAHDLYIRHCEPRRWDGTKWVYYDSKLDVYLVNKAALNN